MGSRPTSQPASSGRFTRAQRHQISRLTFGSISRTTCRAFCVNLSISVAYFAATSALSPLLCLKMFPASIVDARRVLLKLATLVWGRPQLTLLHGRVEQTFAVGDHIRLNTTH